MQTCIRLHLLWCRVLQIDVDGVVYTSTSITLHLIATNNNTLPDAAATHNNTLPDAGVIWYVLSLLVSWPLQHIDTHCNTHATTYCNKLQLTTNACPVWYFHDHCNTLQRATTNCNTLQHATTHWRSLMTATFAIFVTTATHCNTLQHTATHYNVL